MPNLSFLAVTFAIHLALAIWIGGAVFLGAVAAPILFRDAPSRTIAGTLAGRMSLRFGRVKALCMIVLVVAAWLRFRRWEVWNDWIALRAGLIVCACALESIATWGIGPRIREARAAIERAGLDFDGDPEVPRPEVPRPEVSREARADSDNARADSEKDADHPLRVQFRRFHGMGIATQSLAALAAAGALFTFF